MPSLVTLYSFSRLVVGAATVVAPTAIGRPWFGEVADTDSGKAMLRAFGVRDAVIGLGGLLAARRGEPVKRWLQLAALCDAVDATVTVTTPADKLGPMSRHILAVATSATAMGLFLSLRAD